ncbi:unnamed protein product [Caenorhabditis angaria]|uniref:PAN-3 domain-containing protein n=1 Tax=Caenorhabditis angaria TaxID=860376 RepID=A0A9P1N120_9PELO|nr:unnamed protein product [Caenorhabditis angaria]
MIIIVWGKPVDFSGCSRIEELENGKDCIDYCEDNVNCILAHITSSDCYNCEGEGMVESLTSSENQKIAFKTNSTTCSKTEFIDYYYNDYTMKYQNDGGYWNVVKNEVPWECEGEWKIFERALGFWCVKLFYIEEKVNVTNTTSNQFCESKDSTLSALEDMNMTNWVKEAAQSYLENWRCRGYQQTRLGEDLARNLKCHIQKIDC